MHKNVIYIYIYIYNQDDLAIYFLDPLSASVVLGIAIMDYSARHPIYSDMMNVSFGEHWWAHVKKSTRQHHSCVVSQQCPACCVSFTLIVCEMGVKWPCGNCSLGLCDLGLSRIHAAFLYSFQRAFFFKHFIKRYICNDMVTAWKNYKLKYISNIQSVSQDSRRGLFAYRIYKEFHINL